MKVHTPRSLELYIYYRLPAADAARCIAAMRAWQRTHDDGVHLLASMHLRADADVQATCMETYRGPAVAEPGFADWLAGEIGAIWRAAALPPVQRHPEWFTPCA